MRDDEFDYGPFKVGDMVELCNLTGREAHLNGRQVLILGPLEWYRGFKLYPIDLAEVKCRPGDFVGVEPGFVRRRRPPPAATGEQKIRAMFDALPVERRAPATAWQVQYDTAQALMKMGVRVRSGKWPVEVA
ncbi:hypothetical protein HH212_00005 [Massilia forsythiae]|uniref:Uncharacterized protein n=1 Tax=Massilia forsythiae TaxID=2728020 RepID=A0A7Z2W1C1_9BURK|nr:hypothetical protein [Massilia forsythiae]QJE03079.1 hypothetical protein HH212_00005 [Massilia forsythiae]